jgi:hypothetical protein
MEYTGSKPSAFPAYAFDSYRIHAVCRPTSPRTIGEVSESHLICHCDRILAREYEPHAFRE